MAVTMVTLSVQAFVEHDEYDDEDNWIEDYQQKLDDLIGDIEECGKNRNTGFTVDVQDQTPMEEQCV